MHLGFQCAAEVLDAVSYQRRVQQGPDAAGPLLFAPTMATLAGGTTCPLHFRCNAENAS